MAADTSIMVTLFLSLSLGEGADCGLKFIHIRNSVIVDVPVCSFREVEEEV